MITIRAILVLGSLTMLMIIGITVVGMVLRIHAIATNVMDTFIIFYVTTC